MKSLTIAVSLRIFALLMVSLYMFAFHDFKFLLMIFCVDCNPYIFGGFMIALMLMSRQQHIYKRNHPTGRLTYQERVLPEFNSNDERESELTGRAAKTAFSLIILLTPITLVLLGFIIISESEHILFYTYLAFISLPIIGLIAYYFSYRHSLLKMKNRLHKCELCRRFYLLLNRHVFHFYAFQLLPYVRHILQPSFHVQ